jgi:RNA polymerase sigma factor (sigma-70 family)
MVDNDDSRDWAALLLGDAEAFGRIFDRHHARVYRHSSRLAPTTTDADDIVAITFLEAWRKRSQVHLVNDSILPWLLVTATNSARNFTRKANRYRVLLAQLPIESPNEDASTRLETGPAQDALRLLSIADQQVITLCVLEGLPERDAAIILGIPAGTVKSRLSRAKGRLAGSLSKQSPPLSLEAIHEL